MTVFSAHQRRPRLTDILNGGASNFKSLWDKTEAAQDVASLPRGTYVAHVVSGELSKAQTGTPGYKLTFKIIEGEHAGRQVWHDLWLTKLAMPMTKRDLLTDEARQHWGGWKETLSNRDYYSPPRDPDKPVGGGTINVLTMDANGDIAGVTDAVYQLTFSFNGGPPPVEPFPGCGPESLAPEEALDCQTPPARCR